MSNLDEPGTTPPPPPPSGGGDPRPAVDSEFEGIGAIFRIQKHQAEIERNTAAIAQRPQGM